MVFLSNGEATSVATDSGRLGLAAIARPLLSPCGFASESPRDAGTEAVSVGHFEHSEQMSTVNSTFPFCGRDNLADHAASTAATCGCLGILEAVLSCVYSKFVLTAPALFHLSKRIRL